MRPGKVVGVGMGGVGFPSQVNSKAYSNRYNGTIYFCAFVLFLLSPEFFWLKTKLFLVKTL